MLAAQIASPVGEVELVERDLPVPGPKKVRIKVRACGVCHSDSLTKMGELPGIVYPRIPGHEVVGTIDELGPMVVDWEPAQRVGVGWFGGIGAPIASGSFHTMGMIVAPCSVNSMSAITNGITRNLLTRSADVVVRSGGDWS